MIDATKLGLKRFALSLLLSPVLSLIMMSASHASAFLPTGVVVSVSIDQQSLSIDDQVWATVQYTNVSNSQVALLKRETALGGGMTEDLFSITYEGVELRYTGIHVKRLAPIASDYVYLAPGQSASEKIDLLRSYPINYKGDYSISLRDSGEHSDGSTLTKASAALTINLDQDRLVRVFKRTPRFQNCSAGQQSEIDAALTSAERIANESSLALQNTPVSLRPSSARYTEWFGAYSAARYTQVQQGMSRIASATTNQTIGFNCDCSNQPGVDPSRTFAFVFPSDAYNMTLCDVFFLVPREGTDSKSGTIVHEISHFNIVAATDDFGSALDQQGSRNLANSSPSSAIRNANAFEYFAENTPFLAVPTQAQTIKDLAVSGVSVVDGKLFTSRVGTISGQVVNLGGSSSTATVVSLRLAGQPTSSPIAQASIPTISSGANVSFELSFTAPSSEGQVSYQVCLSAIAGETNLNNNCVTIAGIEVRGNVVIAPIIPLLLGD